MATKPPATEPAALIAFAIIDALLRKLVAQQSIMAGEAADMLSGIVADLRASGRPAAKRVVPILEEMLKEYRKQAR